MDPSSMYMMNQQFIMNTNQHYMPQQQMIPNHHLNNIVYQNTNHSVQKVPLNSKISHLKFEKRTKKNDDVIFYSLQMQDN